MVEERSFVAYYRVSTQRQGDSGLGLDAQRAQVERHVAHVGGTIIAAFTEIESGKRVTRPELDAAIASAKSEGATLIVAKLDRLARNARYLLKLRDSKLPITFCDLPDVPSGAVGNFMIGQMALVAEFERDRISERTKSALAIVKKRGKRLGTNGRALARRNRSAARDFARVLRDNVVALGFDLREFKIAEAMEFLNTNAMLTPTGKSWRYTTTRRLLCRMRGLDG